MKLAQEKTAAQEEAYRISGRLKIIATFWAIGRDDSAFDMLTKEIDKMDNLCEFLTFLNSEEMNLEANTAPVITIN
jgi:hypothetical protein